MKNKILEAVFVLAAISLVLYFLFEIRQILIYIIISLIVAIIGRPLVKKLNNIKIGKFHIPNSISAAITIFSFLGIILLLGIALIPLLNEQARSLSLLDIDQIEQNVTIGRQFIDEWLASHGFQNLDIFGGEKLKDLIDFSFIPNVLNSIVGAMGGLSIGLLTVSFITFFILKDKELISESVLAVIPEKKVDKVENVLKTIKESLSRYLLGLVIQVSILFVMYTILLYVAGIKNFVIIATLGALLNLIPYVGPLIGIIMMLILSITGNITEEFHEVILPMITTITIGYIIIQLIDNFFNQPIIFSKSANAHPLEIFLVILIAGNLAGIVGMIVAVPAFTILRIVMREFFSEFKIVKSFTKSLK